MMMQETGSQDVVAARNVYQVSLYVSQIKGGKYSSSREYPLPRGAEAHPVYPRPPVYALGLGGLCRHNLGNNRALQASSIMRE